MNGRQLVSEYIERGKPTGASQAKLARKAQISESHLSLFLKGERRLGPTRAKRLSDATGGEVPFDCLVLPDEAAE